MNITTSEISGLWGISVRRVVKLCSEGRIEGATLSDKGWLIPDKAIKPTDKRIRTGKYTKTMPAALSKVINTVTEGDCLSLMKNIPCESMAMILCDIPWNGNCELYTPVNYQCSTMLRTVRWHPHRTVFYKGFYMAWSKGLDCGAIISVD